MRQFRSTRTASPTNGPPPGSAARAHQYVGDIDGFDAEVPPLRHFILPGGTPVAAALHVARTVCRRAERLAVEAATREGFNEQAVVYLNRLSDLLFVLARWANHAAGAGEDEWRPDATGAA